MPPLPTIRSLAANPYPANVSQIHKSTTSTAAPPLANAPGITTPNATTATKILTASSTRQLPATLRPLKSFTANPADQNTIAYANYAAIESSAGIKQVSALSMAQLKSLYRDAIQNPVAALDRVEGYDPDGIIGFCFGRAMAAHLLARRMGLSPESIRKLFIVGDLRSNAAKPEWRFHVTTVVRGTDNRWYAIDPIMFQGSYTPLTVSAWIKNVRQGWDSWHGDPAKAKLYLTPADAVLPDITTLPEPEDGTKLNQLNFDPIAHGILPSKESLARFGIPATTETIHELDAPLAHAYFLTTDESVETRFDFIGISINGEPIPYRGYFTDLIASLKGGVLTETTRSLATNFRGSTPRRQHGGSFNLARILHP